MERYLWSAATVVALLILQTTFIPFLSLSGILPDLLLIWVVVFAIRRGQVEGMVAGFIVGLLEDLLMTQFFGLSALTKTIAGFAAGYFFNENKTVQTLGTYRLVLIILGISFLHNVVRAGIFLQGSATLSFPAVMELSVASACYTAALGALPMFYYSRFQTA
jgi:rod shape-determining protein MreD